MVHWQFLTWNWHKLTQHCTSNLPQSSQYVKCNADCWTAFLNPTAWPLVVYRELLQSEITTGYSRYVVPCFWPGNNQTADHVGKKFMGKNPGCDCHDVFPAFSLYLPGFQTVYQLLGDKHFTNSNGHETDNPWPKFQKVLLARRQLPICGFGRSVSTQMRNHIPYITKLDQS